MIVDITENNYSTENSNVPDKMEVNMSDLETVMRQMKNNKSSGYNELTTDMIKAAVTTGTQ
jgi:iron uptake system EfeUOB component EfeO/EfeM